MNTGTHDLQVAARWAQANADRTRLAWGVFVPATGVGGPFHIEPVNQQAQHQYSETRRPVGSDAIRLSVDRVRRGDQRMVEDCLCLNGSAHANTARNIVRVTCPHCLDIHAQERAGVSREEARQQTTNPESNQ